MEWKRSRSPRVISWRRPRGSGSTVADDVDSSAIIGRSLADSKCVPIGFLHSLNPGSPVVRWRELPRWLALSGYFPFVRLFELRDGIEAEGDRR